MKQNSKSRGVGSVAVVLLAALTLSGGCASISVQSSHYTSGRILVLPPRDLVQGGQPHPKGAGSGALFQDYLRQSFRDTPFVVVTTESKAFGATQIAEKNDALEEAKRLNADYCLQVILGEFLNAAPMTFRPDHASVEKALMYEVATGNVVWALNKPLYLQKSNPGDHLVLLEKHARAIARSIHKNMK